MAKDNLLTDDELEAISEHRFYFSMSLRDRIKIRDNMESLRKKHRISMSKLFRKVMLEYMNDDEFLKLIGLLDNPTGKVWYNEVLEFTKSSLGGLDKEFNYWRS